MYIEENIDDEYERAKAIVETRMALKPVSSNRSYEMRLRNRQPLVDELYNVAKPLNDELSIDIKQSELRQQFLACWSTASTQIYQKYETKPFLHLFDAEEVCQAFEIWKLSDIIVFGQFIESRYTVSNIREYLEDEFEFVRLLKEHLDSRIQPMPASRLKGCLNLLAKDYLDKGVKLIEKAERYNRG